MPLRVLLVERSALVRTGLRRILDDEPDLAVVAEASAAREAVAALSHAHVDVVILCSMVDRDAIRAFAMAARPLAAEIKIVCLSHFPDCRDVDGVLGAGVMGCVELCDATDAELKMAVCLVGRGKPYLSPGLSRGPAVRTPSGEADWQRLTAREREILVLIAQSQSNREIARALNLSANTIAVHRNHIMKKIGVRKATGLALFAAERGLLLGK